VRKANGQLPSRVIPVGLNDDGAFTFHVRGREVRAYAESAPWHLPDGDAIWFDHDVCSRKTEIKWGTSTLRPRIDAIYLEEKDGLVELPVWPHNRRPEAGL
jgi:hypothetical protein